MRFLFKTLLAATALIPVATAANAQDAPRGRGEGRQRSERQAARDTADQPQPSQPDPGQWRAERAAARAAQPEAQADRAQRRAERAAARTANPQVQMDARVRGGDRRQDTSPLPMPGVQIDARGGAGGGWNRPDRAARAMRRDDRAGSPIVRPGDGAAYGQRDRDVARDPNAYNQRDRGQTLDRTYGQRDRDVTRPDGAFGQRDRDARRGNDAFRQRDRDRDRDWNRARGDNGQWRGNDRGVANGRFDGDRRAENRGVWNRTWRNDRRFDWGGYRNTNRSAYRLPRYYAPYGWGYGYRRFSIGVTLNSILFGQNYWIDDPYDYRLPAAYGPYRWVRYYNDALLVDVRYGQVVDVVHDIFW